MSPFDRGLPGSSAWAWLPKIDVGAELAAIAARLKVLTQLLEAHRRPADPPGRPTDPQPLPPRPTP
jgi:hypothetical protein